MSDDGTNAVIYLFGNSLTCTADTDQVQQGRFTNCGWITPTVRDVLMPCSAHGVSPCSFSQAQS